MKHLGKIVLTALLLAMLPGCASKKAKIKPPAIAQAPTTNDQAGVMYPSPLPQTSDAPTLPAPESTEPKVTPPPPSPPPRKPSTRKKTSTTANKTKPAGSKP